MPKLKRTVKKIIKKTKKVVKKKVVAKKNSLSIKPIGLVTHFYSQISVAIIKFNKPLAAGTQVHFKGHSTDFIQIIESMQYDHKPLTKAPKGKEIGTKVDQKVREGDMVLLEK